MRHSKSHVHAIAETSFQPPADVYQTASGWLIKVDLAGVRESDISLSFSGGRVTIEGIRRDMLIEPGCLHYRMEIAYSEFRRTIELPTNVVSASLTSELRDGMLIVRVNVPSTFSGGKK